MTLEEIAAFLDIDMGGLLTMIGNIAKLTKDEWNCWKSGTIPKTAETRIARAITGLVRYALAKSNEKQDSILKSKYNMMKIQDEIECEIRKLETENNNFQTKMHEEMIDLFEKYRNNLQTALMRLADTVPKHPSNTSTEFPLDTGPEYP